MFCENRIGCSHHIVVQCCCRRVFLIKSHGFKRNPTGNKQRRKVGRHMDLTLVFIQFTSERLYVVDGE